MSRSDQRKLPIRWATPIFACVVLVAAWSSGAAYASTWTSENSQKPDATLDQLSAVSCVGAAHCMAVGYWYKTNYEREKTFAERWNGKSFVIVHTPNPQGTVDDQLNAVSCSTANICEAVGDSVAAQKPIIERWSDGKWRAQSPANAGATLEGISCASIDSCVAVGNYGTNRPALIEGWNGSRWTVEAKLIPSGYGGADLRAVSCTSTIACVAVGSATDSGNTSHLFAVTWNGRSWTPDVLAYPPQTAQGTLDSVSCPTVNECVAVGSDGTSSKAVSEIWKGSSWTYTPLTSGTDTTVASSVSCTASTFCETVGWIFRDPWAATWNGSSWSNDQTFDGAGQDFVYGTSCTPSGGCTAVGLLDDGGGPYNNFVMHN